MKLAPISNVAPLGPKLRYTYTLPLKFLMLLVEHRSYTLAEKYFLTWYRLLFCELKASWRKPREQGDVDYYYMRKKNKMQSYVRLSISLFD